MRKSNIKKKDKNTVNPNPDLAKVPYEYNKSYGVTLNELNEGYAFYLAFNDEAIYSKIKELSFKKETLIKSNKERLKRIKKESEEFYKEFQNIQDIEAQINEMNNDLSESNLLDAPAVQVAVGRLYELVRERNIKLENIDIKGYEPKDKKLKHWNVQKIDFTTVKQICEEENAPVRAVIQKIVPTVLRQHFKGCSRFIKSRK